jgi:hypothetical protein
MIYRGRLAIDADESMVEYFAHGPVNVLIENIEVGAGGELLRHHLRCLSVERLSTLALAASEEILDGRTGPLVRVIATHPGQEDT